MTTLQLSQRPPKCRQAWLVTSLAAGLCACASLNAATNVLTNPGFEAGAATGWSTYGSHAVESTNNTYYNGGSAVGASNVVTLAGRFVGKTWGGFTGSYNANGFFQDSVAGPGSIWSGSGNAFTHEQDLMQEGNQFWIEMTFRDASDTILGMYRSAILDPAALPGIKTNAWMSLTITNEYDIQDTSYQTITNSATTFAAPAGTAKVRFQAVYAQLAGYPGGSIYMDEMNLTKVAGSDPDITGSPASQTKVEGQTVSFTVAAVGGSPIQYRWQKDGADIPSDPRITGATGATLTISNVSLADAGKYTVIVKDNAGEVTSSAANLSVVTVSQASNVLENPGFESGADAPWQKFNGGGIVQAINDGTPLPDGSLYARQVWNGGGQWNGIFQDVPTSPGQAYTADAWFLVSSADPITGASEGWLEVQFMDANGNMIGLYQSEHINSNSVPSTWINLHATNIIAFWGDYSIAGQAKYLVAPQGAAKVRYQVTYRALDGAGSVYFDNMNFFLKAPVTLKATRLGNEIQLTFPAQVGVTYQLLYKDRLEDADWHPLTTLVGSLSGTGEFRQPITGANRFYRVNTQ